MKVVVVYTYIRPMVDNHYGLEMIFNHHPFNPIDIKLIFQI
jgi:hypothetical protein